MLGEFLKWWGEQLAELVPARARAGAGGNDGLIADVSTGLDAGNLSLWQRQQAQETPLGNFTCDEAGMEAMRNLVFKRPARVWLRVPAALLLERLVVLPVAAERNWRNALRYEMNRLTPFDASQVFWDGAIERRNPAGGKVTLRLSVIPKSALSRAIAVLGAVGLFPIAAEVPGEGGGIRSIPLAETATANPRHHAALWVLGGVCAALAVAAVILPFALQTVRGAAIARDIARLQPAVARVQALRQDSAAGAASAGVIAAARAEVGNPLTVLAAVTDALPDDSFLTELTLNHLQLNIAGQAASAAPLLAALSGTPNLTNVTFSAPVTRDAGKQQDLFAIQTNVVAR